ncbi:DUF934 domain-containing protein [Sulfuricystis multivorans]|uniref:DUF934 domain-containing protein n=1 Tax=Sulfuricystis multivorans TaxID=2211108 RepID=UPI000F826F63|nr:DUF934 domain-containing protein [Sulfuricystis multivorans]
MKSKLLIMKERLQMAKLIKRRAVVANDWNILTLAEGTPPAAARLPYGDVLVPLAVWQARKWDLIQRQWNDGGQGNRLGIWLAPTDDPLTLAGDLEDLDVIAVHFPAVGDGRGYSIARMLRSRLGYRGELRAIGAVERDYLHFLERVGFDAFEIEGDESVLDSFDTFSVAYQPTTIPGSWQHEVAA